jgi:hypothetical protein
MAAGKWDHMMDQTHIGYTYWQQPPVNKMPDIKTLDWPPSPGSITATGSSWGVSIEGSSGWWPGDTTQAMLPGNATQASLPGFDVYEQSSHYIEVFNRGQLPFDYTIESGAPWLHVTSRNGMVHLQDRIEVSVDWRAAPAGRQLIPLTITGPEGRHVVVMAAINNPASFKNRTPSLKKDPIKSFIETNGYVSMEAEHYTKAIATEPVKWQRIPELGRTLSGMQAFPVTAPAQTPGGNSPRLQYELYLSDSGIVNVQAYFSPTLDFTGAGRLRYGISFDEEVPQIINLASDTTKRGWEQSVADNIRIMVSRHRIAGPGQHTLKFWMVDPGLVLQKIVVDAGGVRPSYLGPPESRRINK